MKLPIYIYGHPVLREVGVDITPEYEGLSELIENMWETMYFSDGIGLAAPQIGRAIRLFVIDADPMKESFPECAGLGSLSVARRHALRMRVVSVSLVSTSGLRDPQLLPSSTWTPTSSLIVRLIQASLHELFSTSTTT